MTKIKTGLIGGGDIRSSSMLVQAKLVKASHMCQDSNQTLYTLPI